VADAVVDASVWVSRLVPLDAHHRAAKQWLDAQERAGALLIGPALMPPEVAGAIARATRRSAIARHAVRRLLRLPALRLVDLDGDLAEHAAWLAADLSLRGTDAVYAALAQRLGVPLVTLDRELRERASTVVQTQEPE
jgi:predicted nucleic acid-binding protein